jgi:hypothetical protein
MSYKVVFLLNALVALAVGLAFLFVPATGLGYFGTETRVPELFIARLFGFSTLMVGVVLWFAKDIADPGAQKGLALALLAGSVVGLILIITGMTGSRAVLRVNGWIPAVVFVLSALVYGFMLFLKPRLKE